VAAVAKSKADTHSIAFRIFGSAPALIGPVILSIVLTSAIGR
jgi:hypothetical protein